MYKTEKITALAESWDEYTMPNAYSGRIDDKELWECDILDTDDAIFTEEPKAVTVSIQFDAIELETIREDINQAMLEEMAEEQLNKRTTIEVSTQPSEFASQFGQELCAVFAQDISYTVEGHEVSDGVTIKSAGWRWGNVRVAE